MTHIKRLICFAIVTALLALGAPLYALEMVKIGVPAANVASLAPVYLAQELGYYSEGGVHLELTCIAPYP